MARGKNAGLGLLALLGFIVYLFSIIFQFIIENWVIIFTLCIIGLVIYLAINYQTNKNEKIEIELKKLKDFQNKISFKLSETIRNIDSSRIHKLNQIEKLGVEITNSNFYTKEKESIEIDEIHQLQNILKEYKNKYNDAWSFISDTSSFDVINPIINFAINFNKISDLIKPELDELKYQFKNVNHKSERVKSFYEIVDRDRIDAIKKIEQCYLTSTEIINIEKEKLQKKCIEIEESWRNKKDKFNNILKTKNSELSLLKADYLNNGKSSIEKFSIEILKNIKYNPRFLLNVNSEYNPDNKVIIIEYLLPNIDLFPKIKEIKFLKTRHEYKEINLTIKEQEKLYEDSIYSIILNSIYHVLKNDSINAINSIVFNGWTDSIDRTIGKKVKSCITSIHCTKDEFLKINLSEVEPKACFKSLKGISAHNINISTSIKPIISIDQNDKRFVESKSIEYDSFTNLASMNWEDFEHLIREIFECEFSDNGGKVKVTQASRDGGVDAIAYDPDPIKGGKIVIQAKRYTNVVGVSSVRDLYGTVLNEGASKGILVTTSDFGSDSFEFSKNKPITLINGGNLLLLLEKHGFKARININEAKEEQKKIKP